MLPSLDHLLLLTFIISAMEYMDITVLYIPTIGQMFVLLSFLLVRVDDVVLGTGPDCVSPKCTHKLNASFLSKTSHDVSRPTLLGADIN